MRRKKENDEIDSVELLPVAKKDWRIVQNEHDIIIREGQPIPEMPLRFIDALRAEHVID